MVNYDHKSQFNGSALPIIELLISGAKHYFVVDTGAMETILSMRLALLYLTESQIQSRKERDIRGLGGSTESFAAHIKCTFVGVTLPFATFVDTRIFGNDFIPNFIISGIIGQDILQQFSAVEFDFKMKVVRFKP